MTATRTRSEVVDRQVEERGCKGIYCRAEVQLRRILSRRGSLSPDQVARIVTAGLPRRLGAKLYGALRARGLLEPRARVSADLREVETDRLLSGYPRALLRLALLGPAGQGRQTDSRHRQAVFQQLSSDLMRAGRDRNSLNYAISHALNHPDVNSDAELASMVRQCIAEREADLSARLTAQRLEVQDMDNPSAPTGPRFTGSAGRKINPEVTQAHVIECLDRLLHDLGERLDQFDLRAGREIFARIEELGRHHTEKVSRAILERCRLDIGRVQQKCLVFETQISTLTKQACDAATVGNHEDAAQALKRLSSIHASRPMLLTEERFRRIRDQIAHSGEQHEHREAAQALIARERAIAVELKKIAAAIHRFHEVSRKVGHDTPEFQQAEAEYQAALREMKSHDTEWLADLMIEMSALLEDLHDPTGRAEEQLNRFFGSVRGALQIISAEVREISVDCGPPTRRP